MSTKVPETAKLHESHTEKSQEKSGEIEKPKIQSFLFLQSVLVENMVEKSTQPKKR